MRMSDWSSDVCSSDLQGRIVFPAAIDGAIYAKHGTTIDTRLTGIEKAPADDATAFPESRGVAPDVATLIAWIGEHVPARLPIDPAVAVPPLQAAPPPRTVRGYVARTAASLPVRTIGEPEGVELAYETVDWRPAESGRINDAIYEENGLQAHRIPGAQRTEERRAGKKCVHTSKSQ